MQDYKTEIHWNEAEYFHELLYITFHRYAKAQNAFDVNHRNTNWTSEMKNLFQVQDDETHIDLKVERKKNEEYSEYFSFLKYNSLLIINKFSIMKFFDEL